MNWFRRGIVWEDGGVKWGDNELIDGLTTFLF